MDLKTDRNCHAKYNLKYHLILVTKYRHECITPEVYETIRRQVEHVAELNNSAVEEISYEADHVHILLSAPPQACLANIINSMKSTSARRARQEHGEYLGQFYWKPYFWSRSYLILSSGGAPIEVIREYIREQGTAEHSEKKKRKRAAITT